MSLKEIIVKSQSSCGICVEGGNLSLKGKAMACEQASQRGSAGLVTAWQISRDLEGRKYYLLLLNHTKYGMIIIISY